MTDGPDIETLDSREVYRNPWTVVREDRIRRRDGSEGLYGVVEKPDFVVVAALADGHLHLVEQYRYPVGARFWELPQGAALVEAPESTAARELREETGITAGSYDVVGFLHPGYGLTNHGFHVVLATGLTQGAPNRDAEEQDMITRAFPVDEVLGMIRDGTIRDAPTVAALSLLHLHGKL